MSPSQQTPLREYADLGFKVFELGENKRPLITGNWKQYASICPTRPTDWQSNVYAAVIPQDFLVVDIDQKKGKMGKDSWNNLCADFGIEDHERQTTAIVTPTGGYHLYFRKPADIDTQYRLAGYPDIEFLSSTAHKAHYIVGAGSKIGQKDYQCLNNFSHLKDIPEALLQMLKKAPVISTGPKVNKEFDSEEDKADFVTYLTTKAPAAIQNQNGDHTTFTVACYGRDLGLSENTVFSLMVAHYNPRCQPPWAPGELETKVENAFQYASGAQGEASLHSLFPDGPDATQPQGDKLVKWDIGRDKLLKPTLRNCVNLTLAHRAVHNNIRQNVFNNAIEICGPVPWLKHREHRTHRWSDEDLLHYRLWLNEEHNVDFSPSTAQDAILRIAINNKYHPVQEYLKGVVWDKVPRIDHWLHLYCGVADNPYTQKVGVMTLVAAVKRIFEPGCKYDHVMVLEGDQGIFKSTLVQKLAREWYICPTSLDPKAPDSVATMQQGWILEIAEMAAFRGFDADEIKAFITREVDVVRFAYGRNPMEFKRHGIAIGTYNPHKYASYLRDTTGNRRFLPVACGKSIKLDAFERDIDQLWAEAYQRYLAGEPTFIAKGSAEEKLHDQEVKNRLMGDAWESIIAEYLALHKITSISVNSVYQDCLMRPIGTCSRSDQMRIASILKDLGYAKERNKAGTGYVYTIDARNVNANLVSILNAERPDNDPV